MSSEFIVEFLYNFSRSLKISEPIPDPLFHIFCGYPVENYVEK
jgi:hypothetical protein